MFKDHFFKTSGLQFDNWVSGSEKFSGLSRNRNLFGDPLFNPPYIELETRLEQRDSLFSRLGSSPM